MCHYMLITNIPSQSLIHVLQFNELGIFTGTKLRLLQRCLSFLFYFSIIKIFEIPHSNIIQLLGNLFCQQHISHRFNSQLQHHISCMFDVFWVLWSSKPSGSIHQYVGGHNKALNLFQTAQAPQINSTSATWTATSVCK